MTNEYDRIKHLARSLLDYWSNRQYPDRKIYIEWNQKTGVFEVTVYFLVAGHNHRMDFEVPIDSDIEKYPIAMLRVWDSKISEETSWVSSGAGPWNDERYRRIADKLNKELLDGLS
jgi:hypothetical protein